jgi:hypothetical protein
MKKGQMSWIDRSITTVLSILPTQTPPSTEPPYARITARFKATRLRGRD